MLDEERRADVGVAAHVAVVEHGRVGGAMHGPHRRAHLGITTGQSAASGALLRDGTFGAGTSVAHTHRRRHFGIAAARHRGGSGRRAAVLLLATDAQLGHLLGDALELELAARTHRRRWPAHHQTVLAAAAGAGATDAATAQRQTGGGRTAGVCAALLVHRMVERAAGLGGERLGVLSGGVLHQHREADVGIAGRCRGSGTHCRSGGAAQRAAHQTATTGVKGGGTVTRIVAGAAAVHSGTASTAAKGDPTAAGTSLHHLRRQRRVHDCLGAHIALDARHLWGWK
mmetsp:Transcript_13254/g.33812  ORF Transcript_13254/g.33812 Transcript_13254/m.33812 type:complete len:285 (-) Transcript_13254:263-1117(-)